MKRQRVIPPPPREESGEETEEDSNDEEPGPSPAVQLAEMQHVDDVLSLEHVTYLFPDKRKGSKTIRTTRMAAQLSLGVMFVGCERDICTARVVLHRQRAKQRGLPAELNLFVTSELACLRLADLWPSIYLYQPDILRVLGSPFANSNYRPPAWVAQTVEFSANSMSSALVRPLVALHTGSHLYHGWALPTDADLVTMTQPEGPQRFVAMALSTHLHSRVEPLFEHLRLLRLAEWLLQAAKVQSSQLGWVLQEGLAGPALTGGFLPTAAVLMNLRDPADPEAHAILPTHWMTGLSKLRRLAVIVDNSDGWKPTTSVPPVSSAKFAFPKWHKAEQFKTAHLHEKVTLRPIYQRGGRHRPRAPVEPSGLALSDKAWRAPYPVETAASSGPPPLEPATPWPFNDNRAPLAQLNTNARDRARTAAAAVWKAMADAPVDPLAGSALIGNLGQPVAASDNVTQTLWGEDLVGHGGGGGSAFHNRRI